jgi:hypothetical protein
MVRLRNLEVGHIVNSFMQPIYVLKKSWFFTLFLLILTTLTSCQSDLKTGPTEMPVPGNLSTERAPVVANITVLPVETPTVSTPALPEATSIFAPDLEPLIAQAKIDLSQRTGIGVDKINVVGIEAVEWPDGSLGCPQPGMLYTQVQVDGLRIFLLVGVNTYEYHSGGGRQPFLCEQPVP